MSVLGSESEQFVIIFKSIEIYRWIGQESDEEIQTFNLPFYWQWFYVIDDILDQYGSVRAFEFKP